MTFLGELYPAQKSGANLLCNGNALLAYEQGTGKTVISIAAAEKLREVGRAKWVLVVCPAAVVRQWENQIEKFTDPKDYKVISYNYFRDHFDSLIHFWWDIIICDEAEAFSNNKSKTAKLLKQFNTIVQPKYKWALTGTAISNKLEELYSIMYWVDKDFLPPWPQFEKTHIVRGRFKEIVKYKNLKPLNKHLQQKLDRKTHKDLAGQMPELVYQEYYIEKDNSIKEAEERLLDSLDDMVDRLEFTEANPKDPKVAKAFHAVRTSVCSQSKLDFCASQVERILTSSGRSRVVIFCFYKEPLYRLKEELAKRGIDAVTFTGNESSKQKQQALEQFDTTCRTLLCSNAGARGLDLTRANYVVHLDIPFSHGLVDQRNKRITRATSESKFAVVIYLLIQDSIEEYYYDIMKKKGQLADAVYTGESDTVTVRPDSLRAFLRHDSSN